MTNIYSESICTSESIDIKTILIECVLMYHRTMCVFKMDSVALVLKFEIGLLTPPIIDSYVGLPAIATE